MVRNQARVVAREVIHHPIGSGNMRVIIGAVNLFGSFLIPTGPRAPVEVAAIKAFRHLVGLIVEETFADSVPVWSVLVLQASPDNAVNELLEFFNLFFIGLNKF